MINADHTHFQYEVVETLFIYTIQSPFQFKRKLYQQCKMVPSRLNRVFRLE
jgi:hypothetical protein